MKLRNSLTLISVITIILLAGCMPAKNEMGFEELASNHKEKASESGQPTTSLPDLPLANRMAWPTEQDPVPADGSENLYSFVARNLHIQHALQIFSKTYRLNFIADSNVDGYLSVEFNDLPFDQAMEAMLESLGLYWERDGQLIKVKGWETRTFTIDYLRLVRSGQGNSSAQISSSVEDGGRGGEDGSDGAIEVTQEDSVEFWKELEEQLALLISKEGRLTINRMSGTVQVSDLHSRIEEVEKYIADINYAVHRQVEIDVRIVEVELSEDFNLGIDWGLVTAAGANGLEGSLATSSIVTRPLGGFTAANPAAALSLFENDNGSINFNMLLIALKQQGEIHVVSQPRIRTLNNQPAMIKVGTDRTFFNRTVTTETTAAGSSSQVEDTPSVVTEGIVLAITPQIAANGWIMMDILPIITRVASIQRVLDGNGNVTSSAPNLDVRQTSSLVRMRNGSTIVVGGLIQDTETDLSRSIPGLGNIPIVGKLFQGNYQVKRKKELVMFLTAKLVDTTTAQISQ